MRRTLTALLTAATLLAQQQDDTPLFRASSNLVIITVFVRGKDGKTIPNLKREDFLLTENSKPQTISILDYQSLTPPAQSTLSAESAPTRAEAPLTDRQRFRDKRLLVLFFDWSSLSATDQIHAKAAAEKFLAVKMTRDDLVQIVSFGTRLKVEQEFTSDRDALLAVIKRFQTGVMSELSEQGATGAESSEDSSFVADDTEFNIFNTDRKLAALEDLSRSLSALPEKKAVVYFSSGVSSTGDDNQAQLRSTVNSAVRANVSFYPIDVRGLQAEPPGGAAASESGGGAGGAGGSRGGGGAGGGRGSGTGLFSGATQNSQRISQINSQDSLEMLASDTGGKALFDNNELVLGIQQAQDDIQSYYILGYYSSDETKDGQYRRVELKLANKSLSAKLDYRRGYFADKVFSAFSSYDKEKQLQDALLLGDPVTDLRLALEVNWFRLNRNAYFTPIAVKIPGSAVPLKKSGGDESTTFDFIGQLRDERGMIAGNVRDTIKIRLREASAGKLAERSLIYDTGFTLSPGTYRVKMLVRENLTGKMGTFESQFTIADLATVKDAPRLSTVVYSTQRVPIAEAVGLADKSAKKQDFHPLVRDKQKLLPSVTHVFRPGQTVSIYAELYDPTIAQASNAPAVAAALTIYQGDKLVFQSTPIQVAALMARRNQTLPLALEVPLKDLPPGQYTAQLTVIDRAGQKAAFPRHPLVLLK